MTLMGRIITDFYPAFGGIICQYPDKVIANSVVMPRIANVFHMIRVIRVLYFLI
jgi:hypothetical protein